MASVSVGANRMPLAIRPPACWTKSGISGYKPTRSPTNPPPTTGSSAALAISFLGCCVSRERLDRLPASLLRGDFARVELPAPKPVSWTLDEVKTLYAAAVQRTKLYVLLGLNCGYTQMDPATLTHEMVNWETGIIDRPRHKTSARQCHRLWPMKTRLGMSGDRRGFKHLRKTSADLLAQQYRPDLVDQFLGHAVGAMRRHYSDQHFGELFEGLEWLRGVYGLSD